MTNFCCLQVSFIRSCGKYLEGALTKCKYPRWAFQKVLKDQESKKNKKKERNTPIQKRSHILYHTPKGYVNATNPSVASMESKHTLEEETHWRIFWCFQRTKMKWRSRVTSYIGIDVARPNAMMSILGNLPGPLKKDSKNTWKHHHQFMSMIIQLATKHQWKTLRPLEERVMASPEPSRRPSTLEWTILLSTEMWTNTTYHIFGTKFCSPPQNLKLINTPLHLNICVLEVQQLLVLTSKSNKAQ